MNRLVVAGVGILLACPSWAQQSPPASFDECAAAVRAAPEDFRGYACYWNVAEATGRWAEAARRLEAYLAVDSENWLAMAYLANVEGELGTERAPHLSRRAAEGLAERGNARGAAHQFLALAFRLFERGKIDEAQRAADDALPLAESTGDPVLLARVLVRQANVAGAREDYGRSLRLLTRAEAEVFPDGPLDLQSQWLSARAYACWALSRIDEAMELYRREADLLRDRGSPFNEAIPRRNLAFLAGVARRPESERRRLALEALEVARSGNNRAIEANTHVDLVAVTEGAERLRHARRGLALARALGAPATINALRAMGQAQIDTDPESAFRALDEAAALARRTGQPGDMARVAVTRAELRWQVGPRESAIADYLAAFDAIEATRNLQPDDTMRALRFASWARPYRELIGRLLSDTRDESDLETAFAVAERHRARVLLDRLDAASATGRIAAGGEVAQRRNEKLREISRLQRDLVGGGLSAAQVDAALEELKRLELAESELRDELARSDPAFAALHRPSFPSLPEIRAALDEDQALLYYQVWPWDREIGSWLLAITKLDVRNYRLPDCTRLKQAVDLFVGLFGARNGSEQVAASRLYDDFLREALDDLPEEVQRLVIAPDASLNLVPFGALQAEAADSPLAAGYEITIVPSATTWLSWRRDERSTARLPALAMVDPELPAADVSDRIDETRSSVLAAAARLGSLSQARREGRAAVRRVGRGSVSLEGGEATERYVKREALRGFGVIHFAAHALVDEDKPERSAVVLAPGAEDEDGLLQIREIVELDLSGQVVVLSACRSAVGPVIGGEGVMDLARAFFQAGASTVVGSLWALRDEEAAELFEAFYRHLGRGESVAAALASAKRERWRAGAPAAAWAGVVVLGNGDAVPRPRGTSRRRTLWWLIAVVLVLGAAAYRLRAGGA